jgi:hypothetical protein
MGGDAGDGHPGRLSGPRLFGPSRPIRTRLSRSGPVSAGLDPSRPAPLGPLPRYQIKVSTSSVFRGGVVAIFRRGGVA